MGDRAVKGEKSVDELRELADGDLLVRREDLHRQMYLARSSIQTGGQQGVAVKVRSMRKEVARILTIIRERELLEFFRKPLL